MSGEDIDACNSQGFVNKPQGSLSQQFGDEQSLSTDGGDAAGQDLYKNNIINIIVPGTITSPSDSQFVQELTRILGQAGGQADSVIQAYRESRPLDGEIHRPDVTDYTKIVGQLREFGRLLEFALRLKQDERIAQPIRTQLNELVEKSAQQNEIELKEASPSTSSSTQVLESHLLVVICPEAGTDRFLVNAWLIADNTVQNRAKRFKPLDLDVEKKGVSCQLEKVPELLNRFLKESLRYLLGKRFDLTIEVFLPLNSLCTAVELWQALDPDNDPFSIGSKYKVIVRSYERLREDYLIHNLNQWQENWDRLKQVLDSVPDIGMFEHLDQIDNCNWKKLAVTLTQKLGLKLACSPSASKHKDLFKAMLKAAVPVAIWSRCETPSFDPVVEIDELLARGPLVKLSQNVLEKRRDADIEDNPEEHLGYYLTVLWEDPDRLTPDATALLMSPGQ